jgi:hypothetical protein
MRTAARPRLRARRMPWARWAKRHAAGHALPDDIV